MARTPTTEAPPVGRYGRDWVQGVVSDHLRPHHQVRRLAGGDWVVVLPDGSAEFVLCSELIWVDTEDGRIDGRCGLRVDAEGYACEGHRLERERWLAMSESEKADWERFAEGERF
jgi:hypothetical protein